MGLYVVCLLIRLQDKPMPSLFLLTKFSTLIVMLDIVWESQSSIMAVKFRSTLIEAAKL